MKRSPPTVSRQRARDARGRDKDRASLSPAASRDGSTAVSPVQGAGGRDLEVSLRELHVFCGAVRVSVVDGDVGEMVLGSLDGMSLAVAATEEEVNVKFGLGSLQIDSHMPG